MEKAIIYIHGQGGSPEEAGHYQPLFGQYDVIGLDYCAQAPWEAAEEFPKLFDAVREKYNSVTVIANSIGAYFAMTALADRKIEKAFFISPVVDMEKLITDMMHWAGVTEKELEEKGIINTSFGQELSWKYLTWVRAHPVIWNHPTAILYGSHDNLQSVDTIQKFAGKCGASVTIMEGGEHWFHTDEQMKFLDQWILRGDIFDT